MQHADLVDDEYIGFTNEILTRFTEARRGVFVECVVHANAGPGMNRGAVQVRGSQTGRCGYGHTLALTFGALDKLIQHIRLARTGSTG